MSLETNYDREISLVPRRVVGVERGREVVADGTPVVGLRAIRDQAGADEDVDQRDEQTTTWRYLVQPRHPETGALIDPTGYDRIIDAGRTLEIVGNPKPARQRRRGRTHHLEFEAREVGVPGATVGS